MRTESQILSARQLDIHARADRPLPWTIADARILPNYLAISLLSLACLAAPRDAQAQSCTITAANGAYGSVDLLSGSAVTTTATSLVSCTGSSGATVRLCFEIGPGNNTDAGGNRVLASGTNTIRHEFYTTAARTTILGSWGSSIIAYTPFPFGETIDLTLNSFGNGSTNVTVYGAILANQQTAATGAYSWTSSGSPGIAYGYFSGAACPTGAGRATSGGSSWTASVASNCNISATNINFGTAGIISTRIAAAGVVTAKCTNATPYQIALGYGAGVGAGVGVRYMTGPASAQLSYNLYQDVACSTVWGDSLGVNTISSTGTGSNQTFNVYGCVPAQSTPAPGVYNDTIIVTVNY